MTIAIWLLQATQRLRDAGITTARLDCLVLLEDALGRSRAWILAHPEGKISPSILRILNKKITQRCTHLPLAYIRGTCAFFGRDFVVNNNVLVPRPETEIMIELLRDLPLPPRPYIADIGTGSGCIGITAGLEIPGSQISLTDVDSDALKIAKLNAELHHVEAQFAKANLLHNLPGPQQIILANLPYVPADYPINRAAGFEPAQAIFAGEDGLDLYKSFWRQMVSEQQKPVFVLTESLPAQHKAVAQLANQAGYHVFETKDFIQVFKPR